MSLAEEESVTLNIDHYIISRYYIKHCWTDYYAIFFIFYFNYQLQCTSSLAKSITSLREINYNVRIWLHNQGILSWYLWVTKDNTEGCFGCKKIAVDASVCSDYGNVLTCFPYVPCCNWFYRTCRPQVSACIFL